MRDTHDFDVPVPFDVIQSFPSFSEAFLATARGRPRPDRASYCSFASFSDPDGNGWLLQEIKERLPGR
jgi:hypothetical protein